MGAVAAAVLGAPISTTLIVFELTGDWQTGLAVMVAVSLSTALASRLVDRSFFLTQLERRGVHLAAGPQAYLLAMFRVAGGDAPPRRPSGAADDRLCAEMIEHGALPRGPADARRRRCRCSRRSGVAFLPVVSWTARRAARILRGALFHVDALRAYNRALAATAAEEHS